MPHGRNVNSPSRVHSAHRRGTFSANRQYPRFLDPMAVNWHECCTIRDYSAFGAVKMKPRISMITLGVRDIERSIRFYEEGLGLPRMESPPEVAFFTLNGSWLALYGREALAEDAGVPCDDVGFSGFSIAHNVESEAEVDALLAQAVDAGATLVKPAQKVFWGGYSCYFSDPDGHLWEVAHNPFFWIGPKDKVT